MNKKDRLIELLSKLKVKIAFCFSLVENMKHKLVEFLSKNFTRILIFQIVFWTSNIIIFNNTTIYDFNKKEIISILISIIAIIVAIIITYIFSKLFSEKTVRVERKKEIDDYSLKITSLRKIAYCIIGMHEFWKYDDINVKSTIDKKYPNLTYEEYRGVSPNKNRTYEEYKQISKDIGEGIGQAYLALKGLTDKDNQITYYNQFSPKNYTAQDIERYSDYCNSFWYFLDTSDNKVNFNKVSLYWLTPVFELYHKIMIDKKMDKYNMKEKLIELMTLFNEDIFEKHYYLTKLNSGVLPTTYKEILFNILIFVIILISSLYIYILELSIKFTYIFTIVLISLFISNLIDLMIMIIKSIRRELDIKEIFKV